MKNFYRALFSEWFGPMFLLATVIGSGIMAVTIAFLLRGEIQPRLALAYVGVQVVGAVCGAILAHFMFELPLIQESAKLRTGMAQWVSEFVATFGLLATIFGTLRWRVKAVVPLAPFRGGDEALYVLQRRHAWMRRSGLTPPAGSGAT